MPGYLGPTYYKFRTVFWKLFDPRKVGRLQIKSNVFSRNRATTTIHQMNLYPAIISQLNQVETGGETKRISEALELTQGRWNIFLQ